MTLLTSKPQIQDQETRWRQWITLYDKIDDKYKDSRKKIDTINWIDYFLGLANIVAQRSKDGQTKHGCIITNQHHKILGVGYNSFARDMPDKILPNLRPSKYAHMIHAEDNALLNVTQDLLNIHDGAIAYVTGKSCIKCLYKMWNAGISTIYAQDRQGSKLESEEEDEFNFIIHSTNLKYYKTKVDFSWLFNFVDSLRDNLRKDDE